MKEFNILDESGKRRHIGFVPTDVEFVNPLEHYREISIKGLAQQLGQILKDTNSFKTKAINDCVTEVATNEWKEYHQKIIQTETPKNFITLISTKLKKKEQEKLLRNQNLTDDTLAALIFKSWTDFGYTFSEYVCKQFHKGFDKSALPTVAHFDELTGKIIKTGKTTLSDKKIKQAIQQRSVTIAKFLDRESEWHCFFATYRGLKGEEIWQGENIPHFHYISDKFRISREDVVKQFKSGKCPTTSIHIRLFGYDNLSSPSSPMNTNIELE